MLVVQEAFCQLRLVQTSCAEVTSGGPVTEDQRGVYGAIGPGGYADSYITPPEFRAGLLLAQGIWPFSPQSFAVGDVRNVNSEADAAIQLRDRVLGHPV